MTGGSEALARAAAQAVEGQADVAVRLICASSASAQDLLECDGAIFAFPENLAAIAGEMKAYFDRAYYPCLGCIEGRPYALIICAGSDGRQAAAQAERIFTGWRCKKIADPIIICTHAQTPEEILAPKTIKDAALEQAAQLGAAFAAGLNMGIY